MRGKMMALAGALAWGLSVVTAGNAVAQQPAAPAAPSFQSVLDGARREGTVVVWVSSPGGAATHRALFDAFNRRFGLSIRGEWSPLPSVQTGTRLIAEAASGRASVDIVGAGGAEEVAVLVQRGIVKSYPWAEVFASQLPTIGAAVGQVIPDLTGRALPFLDAVYGLAWNPQMIRDEEVPESLAQLADPRWRGRFAINAFFLIPVDTTSYLIGREATLDLVRRLIANRPVLERGTPAVGRAVSVGQVPLGLTTFHVAERARRANEPVRFRLFSDFIPIIPTHVYVPENSPNPNAARLFAAWLATEGAAVADPLEPTPRAGVAGSPVAELIRAQRERTNSRIVTAGSLQDITAGEAVRQVITQMLTEQAR